MNDQAADHAQHDRRELADPRNPRATEYRVNRNAAKHSNGENADVQERAERVFLFFGKKRNARSPWLQSGMECENLFALRGAARARLRNQVSGGVSRHSIMTATPLSDAQQDVCR